MPFQPGNTYGGHPNAGRKSNAYWENVEASMQQLHQVIDASKREALITKLYSQAMNGSTKAAEILWKHIFGQPPASQRIEHSGSLDHTLIAPTSWRPPWMLEPPIIEHEPTDGSTPETPHATTPTTLLPPPAPDRTERTSTSVQPDEREA